MLVLSGVFLAVLGFVGLFVWAVLMSGGKTFAVGAGVVDRFDFVRVGVVTDVGTDRSHDDGSLDFGCRVVDDRERVAAGLGVRARGDPLGRSPGVARKDGVVMPVPGLRVAAVRLRGATGLSVVARGFPRLRVRRGELWLRVDGMLRCWRCCWLGTIVLSSIVQLCVIKLF